MREDLGSKITTEALYTKSPKSPKSPKVRRDCNKNGTRLNFRLAYRELMP